MKNYTQFLYGSIAIACKVMIVKLESCRVRAGSVPLSGSTRLLKCISCSNTIVSCPAPSSAKSEKGSGLPCMEPVAYSVRQSNARTSHMTGELCK